MVENDCQQTRDKSIDILKVWQKSIHHVGFLSKRIIINKNVP